MGQVPEVRTFTVGKLIPDGNPNGLVDSQTITSAIGSLGDVDVYLNLSGQPGSGFLGDLYVALQHSGGYSVLLNRVGRSTAALAGYSDAAMDVTFDDSATLGDIHKYRAVLDPLGLGLSILNLTGSWQPDGRFTDPSLASATDGRLRMLNQMIGKPASGVWSLLVVDLGMGRTTRLESWGLRLTPAATTSFAVTTAVSGQGKITLLPALASYPPGTVVQATASAFAGYGFDRWTSGSSGVNPVVTFSMSSNKVLVASFKPLRSLTLVTNGIGSISVTPSGSSFLDGTTVSVNATPGLNQIFNGWTGDRVGTNPTVAVTLTSNVLLNANFTPVYSLNLSSGVGGTAVSSPSLTNWVSGTTAILRANPSAGYVFLGWTGALTGSQNPVSVAMTSNKSITANFLKIYQLSAGAQTGGTLSWSPAGTNFTAASTVTLTAKAAAGYAFSGWSGALTGTQNPAPLAMTASRVVTANFSPYALLNLSSTAGGTATASPAGSSFVPGTVVFLTATPNPGYAFAGWSGGLTGLQSPASVVMSSGKTITASFVKVYRLSATAQLGGTVSWSPSGTNFASGTAVNLTATASAGYAFTGWSGDLSGTQNPAVIILSTNRNIAANFKPLRTVSITTYGSGQVIPNGGVFPEGTVLTLRASPNPGNAWWFWFGNANGTTTNFTFTVTTNASIGVYFVPLYSLTISNSTGGTVVASAEGVRLTNNVKTMLRAYSTISLTATPAVGYFFKNWSGAITNANFSTSFSLLANASIKPVFASIATGLAALSSQSQPADSFKLGISFEDGLPLLNWPNEGSQPIQLWESDDFVHWRLATTNPPPFHPSGVYGAIHFFRIKEEEPISGSAK